jgi:LacI family transcriptional regulator
MKNSNVTIHDVARRAGVSHTTVSWALNDDPRITAETKRRVGEAARELDYRPNLSARSLVSGKIPAIAVVASFFSSAFEMEIMRGFEERMERSLSDFAFNQYTTRGIPGKKDEVFRSLRSRASVVISLNLVPAKSIIDQYDADGITLILIEESRAGTACVTSDNRLGGRLAVEHLVSRGRKRIGMVSGRLEGPEEGLSARERLAGYRDALRDSGLPADPRRFKEVGRYYPEEGGAAFRAMLEAAPDTDALFCSAGDMVALGVLAEARRMGVRIPEEVALVGYDNIDAAALVMPALTTLGQPLRAMGSRTIEIALKAMDGEEAGKTVEVFKPELIVRDST